MDTITTEILKIPGISNLLLDIFNDAFIKGKVPDMWLVSLLVPVPKKGDLSKCGNYRGIALMSCVAKLYNKILLKRLQQALNSKLRQNQNGFRPGRSTNQHILALRRLIEECSIHQNSPLIAIFIDFKKAFDSVKWSYIHQILISYNVPDLLCNAIMSMYYGAKTKVTTSDGLSDDISLSTGVLQGDTLAPFLFVIVMDYIFRVAVKDSTLGFQLTSGSLRPGMRNVAKFITDLAFADDVALLSSSINNAKKLLKSIEKIAATVGLFINLDKTEYIMVGDWKIEDYKKEIKINEGKIKLVTDFKYLGSWVMSSSRDFEIRKESAWKAALSLNRIWKSKILSRNTILRIFKSTVESVLLYGSETWSMTKALNKRLDGCYTKLLRYIFNIRWTQHISNIELYGKLDPISIVLRKRRLRFAGHCFRSFQSEPQPISDLLFWQPNSKFNGKHAKKTYLKQLIEDSGGRSIDELKVDMLDRDEWRRNLN